MVMQSLIHDFSLRTYEELDSTNVEARRLIMDGDGVHGGVVWSKVQSEGRGRYDRDWVSEDGNLFVSILLTPGVPLEECVQLSLLAAVSIAEMLEDILPEPERVTLKWPNDVLVDGKKIAGILLESFCDQKQNERWIVVGIGINILHAPERVAYPSTYLQEQGLDIVSAKIILSRLLYHFGQRYEMACVDGFQDVRAAWLKRAHAVGDTLRITLPDAIIEGTFNGLSNQGELILKDGDGTVHAIAAGDVFPLEAHEQKA